MPKGNENYLPGEIGAKTPAEWGIFVREAGRYLDWISIHDYWDPLWQNNHLSDYERCMGYSAAIEQEITKTIHIIGSLGYSGKLKIAFDEWNLRGWHHPNVDSDVEDYLGPRELNNLNAGLMGDTVVDSWLPDNLAFAVPAAKDGLREIGSLDIVATKNEHSSGMGISIVNRHPEKSIVLEVSMQGMAAYGSAELHSVLGESKDAFNDICINGISSVKQNVEAVHGRNLKSPDFAAFC